MAIPKLQPVESTAVARIGYDQAAEEAYVEYIGGALYAYRGVPLSVFEELTEADSQGSFVNAVIKRYPFRRC